MHDSNVTIHYIITRTCGPSGYRSSVERYGEPIPHQGSQLLRDKCIDEKADDEDSGKEDGQNPAEEGVKAAVLIITHVSPARAEKTRDVSQPS